MHLPYQKRVTADLATGHAPGLQARCVAGEYRRAPPPRATARRSWPAQRTGADAVRGDDPPGPPATRGGADRITGHSPGLRPGTRWAG